MLLYLLGGHFAEKVSRFIFDEHKSIGHFQVQRVVVPLEQQYEVGGPRQYWHAGVIELLHGGHVTFVLWIAEILDHDRLEAGGHDESEQNGGHDHQPLVDVLRYSIERHH